MSKVFMLKWDEVDNVYALLNPEDTANINNIDASGSDGLLSLGRDSTAVVIGKDGNVVIISGSLQVKSDFTASAGAMITGTVNLPGQTSFALDSVSVTTEKFTAPNLSKLFNGSNVDDLHSHSTTGISLSGSLIRNSNFVYDFGAGQVISGSQIVYISGSNTVKLADADFVKESRIVGIASGSLDVIYTSGSLVPIHTVYGDIFDGFSGLNPGKVYYLSDTAGDMTLTPSIHGNKNIVQIGIAVSSNRLVFQPSFETKGKN